MNISQYAYLTWDVSLLEKLTMKLADKLLPFCSAAVKKLIYLYVKISTSESFLMPTLWSWQYCEANLSHFGCFLIRHFNLRMKRDTSLFTDDFKVEVSGEVLNYDVSHIYTGEIYGKIVNCKPE